MLHELLRDFIPSSQFIERDSSPASGSHEEDSIVPFVSTSYAYPSIL